MPWLAAGWRLFLAAPAIWVAVSIVLLLIHGLLGLVPVLGGLASLVLMPVLAGGLMAGCAAVDRGEGLRFDCLLVGFRDNTRALVTLGLLQLAGFGAVGLLVFAIGGGAMMGSMMGHGVGGGLGATIALGGLLFASLLAMLLLVPLTMAIWFAPALVMLSGMAPLAAMKASLDGCMRNWLPFLVYGIVLFVLCILAILPAGLGLLVLVPVLTASIYVSYREIYF